MTLTNSGGTPRDLRGSGRHTTTTTGDGAHATQTEGTVEEYDAPPTPTPTDIIANRRWVHRDSPFPHVVARSVFHPEFLDAAWTDFHDRWQRESARATRAEHSGRWDLSLTGTGGPLGVFLSRSWQEIVASLCGVPVLDSHLTGALVRHGRGALSEQPHTGMEQEATIPDPPAGIPGAPSATDRMVCVAVAEVFLGNVEWSPPDGGETALYDNSDGTQSAVPTMPPVDNSVIAFGCTPSSWHGVRMATGEFGCSRVVSRLYRPHRAVLEQWGPRWVRT